MWPRKTRLISSAIVYLAAVLVLSSCGGDTRDRTDRLLSSKDSVQPDPAVRTAEQPADSASDTGGTLLQADGNDSGKAVTFSAMGAIDKTNPFFKPFGNGRTCESCHQQNDGWSITPRHLRERFVQTAGNDPIFALVDGANSPLADVSTADAKQAAYSLLLAKGLIRVGLGIPDGAEFELIRTDDPYGFASAKELSLYRRPLPSTNLRFLSTVMWDARETSSDPNSIICIVGTANCFAPLNVNLARQSDGAVRGHAEAVLGLTEDEQQAIVTFEMSLFTAQVYDNAAQMLTYEGGRGGPARLATQDFYFGINDVLAGDYRTHQPFDPNVMTLYQAWRDIPEAPKSATGVARARRAIARGELLFNTKPIDIVGVGGINDDLKVPVFKGTCTTCHDAPNSGNHSTPMPLNIGLSDASRRTPDMPLYALKHKFTGEVIETTDPGRALLTGLWKDVGRFKGPVLRGLAARPPYFHNGSAQDLEAVVDFYDTRFNIGFTEEERADLAAFLKAL
ncbi:hypothetical protein SAMN06265795_113107 [Noviherbaspirillum humi]|uniref:Cytochrome c domain-containing protein n=1 Tax=Noviherbaspirillum humi TaxID=1688639 RepID=A0A239JTQ8_9BURK|nr:hypothetical protein [Noviherbaspirillum humi]SNT09251.1 hypothetical protein SAMN06265795_113107 [Noviherbaspirillum humi]